MYARFTSLRTLNGATFDIIGEPTPCYRPNDGGGDGWRMVGVARAGQTASYVARVYAPAAATMSLYGGAGSANSHVLAVGWNTVRGVLLGGAQLAGRVINLTAAAGAMYVAWVRINQDPPVYSGVYTPALANVSNIVFSSTVQCNYMRNGDTIMVAGQVNITPFAINTVTLLRISLPVPSNFSDEEDCGGTAVAVLPSSNSSAGGTIVSHPPSNLAELQFVPATTVIHPMWFNFMYRIR